MQAPPASLRLCLLLLACAGMTACTSLGYYMQSVSGQLQVMRKDRPLENVIDDRDTDAKTRDKLVFIRAVLGFAHTDLALPDNGSYRSYADLERPYVTWNVFAAPELSLKARQWCYLFVGCLDYRGYFSRRRAVDYAMTLQKQGWDVFVGGVRAYSTLGWFRDPVLNTMLGQEDWEIARLLFHELAHQRLYLDGETEVNEAFAETVARIGLDRWLATRTAAERRRVHGLQAHEDALMGLLLDYRDRLAGVYGSTLSASEKLTKKAQLFAGLREGYHRIRERWDDDRFDGWMEQDLNNARLVAIATYRRLLPAFLALYNATGHDLARFYKYMKKQKNCDHRTLLRHIMTYSLGQQCRAPEEGKETKKSIDSVQNLRKFLQSNYNEG